MFRCSIHRQFPERPLLDSSNRPFFKCSRCAKPIHSFYIGADLVPPGHDPICLICSLEQSEADDQFLVNETQLPTSVIPSFNRSHETLLPTSVYTYRHTMTDFNSSPSLIQTPKSNRPMSFPLFTTPIGTHSKQSWIKCRMQNMQR